jgi:hypothetical protein
MVMKYLRILPIESLCSIYFKNKRKNSFKEKHQSYLIIVCSGLLRGIMWSETDGSALPISPIFKGQLLGQLDP